MKKRKGDKVAVGDILFAYETDKASFEEESKFEGTVLELLYNEGDEVTVLSNVMIIGEPGENIEQYLQGDQSVEAPAAVQGEEVAVVVESKAEQQVVHAVATPGCGVSPRARHLA